MGGWSETTTTDSSIHSGLVGLSRSSQGQANRSTKPPRHSSKATDEFELREEDGPAESAIAEPTAAGLAAAESATAATAAGMAAPESATRREPVHQASLIC